MQVDPCWEAPDIFLLPPVVGHSIENVYDFHPLCFLTVIFMVPAQILKKEVLWALHCTILNSMIYGSFKRTGSTIQPFPGACCISYFISLLFRECINVILQEKILSRYLYK
ncbi:Hypothetical predicted protein [Olea europaea subsp. europaea]|uniref:Uncharacterized protein n=1 Tax=Olea europaea subsp. europaea TaxID=158383 RepID=A0A8S0S735_OLEEU|nr:Hypothetical predicted protein [Olea europaea subsp. europaea]